MDASVAVLVITFILFLLINVPIAIAIIASTLLTMLFTVDALPTVTTIAQRISAGMNSFALLAIPLFILSGYLMGQGGIAKRLIGFARVIVGRLPGGLALVNVIACALFGSVSGSAVAATSAIGGFMIPAMEKEGYDREFSTAVTITASTTGLLIPPSNILIIFSLASGGVSIAALFIGGYLPGLLVVGALMIVCSIYAKKQGYPIDEEITSHQAFSNVLGAIPSLLLIFLILGGIIGGFVTPTEAGAIAVLYSLLLSMLFYREIKPRDLPGILEKTVATTSIVMLLIGASAAMSWLLSYESFPQMISAAILDVTAEIIIILILVNILLLAVGTFMDITPAVLIFTPILMPVMESIGISPLHFGIMMILNLSIGLCTPPVGSVLFVGCSIGKTRITDVIKPLIPMYFAMLAVLALVIYFPALSEALPKALDLY